MPASKTPIVRDLVAAVIFASVFTWLAVTSLQPQVPPIDLAIRNAIHAFSAPALTAAMRVVTNLGSWWFLLPFGLILVFQLSRENRRREAALLAVAVFGANILDQVMKLAFHRIRPDPFFGYDRPVTFSFPSGHAFVSCCFYLALAEILTPPEWPASRKAAAWLAACLVTAAIGLSRIYLGVHYPTDVAGGYAAALSWVCLVRAAHAQWWHPARRAIA